MVNFRTPKNRAFVAFLVTIAMVLMTLAPTTFALASTPSSTFCSSKQKLENFLKQYLGIPYRKGGITKKGMDCSGFARTVYRQLFGVELPHSSRDQYHSPDLQKVTKDRLQVGDLVFFGRKKKINHVGVYLTNNKFIHASSSLGITISSLDEGYWKKRFIGSKRSPNPVELNTSANLLATPNRDDFAANPLPLAGVTEKG